MVATAASGGEGGGSNGGGKDEKHADRWDSVSFAFGEAGAAVMLSADLPVAASPTARRLRDGCQDSAGRGALSALRLCECSIMAAGESSALCESPSLEKAATDDAGILLVPLCCRAVPNISLRSDRWWHKLSGRWENVAVKSNELLPHWLYQPCECLVVLLLGWCSFLILHHDRSIVGSLNACLHVEWMARFQRSVLTWRNGPTASHAEHTAHAANTLHC